MSGTFCKNKIMVDNDYDNDFEEDTLRGVYKLNETSLV